MQIEVVRPVFGELRAGGRGQHARFDHLTGVHLGIIQGQARRVDLQGKVESGRRGIGRAGDLRGHADDDGVGSIEIERGRQVQVEIERLETSANGCGDDRAGADRAAIEAEDSLQPRRAGKTGVIQADQHRAGAALADDGRHVDRGVENGGRRLHGDVDGLRGKAAGQGRVHGVGDASRRWR